MEKSSAPSPRTRVKRLHERAHYDADTIHAILDATPLCSVGYVFDGAPYVTSTMQWREGDHVYWHGSSASRMLRSVENAEICMNVSILDGFVIARSGMHHSVNSRSVMLFGTASKVTDKVEKEQKLNNFVDHLFPGRSKVVRPINDQELKATTLLSMPIAEASAKVRAEGPHDDDDDYDLPIWAGVIPVKMQTFAPEQDPDSRADHSLPIPDHILNFKI